MNLLEKAWESPCYSDHASANISQCLVLSCLVQPSATLILNVFIVTHLTFCISQIRNKVLEPPRLRRHCSLLSAFMIVYLRGGRN